MANAARDIDWEYLDPADAAGARTGELVSAEPGGMPIYRVLAFAEGRAHLRDLQDGADCILPLSAFHWKAAAPKI
jgi:hypothetical protein